MPGLAHVPPPFNAEQCPAYLHTLRWQDRPLPWPRCRSAHMGRWGTSQYRPGGQRSGCHGGQRTFNDLPATLLPQRQRARSHGILAPFWRCLACSSRRMAREGGVHSRTSDR